MSKHYIHSPVLGPSNSDHLHFDNGIFVVAQAYILANDDIPDDTKVTSDFLLCVQKYCRHLVLSEQQKERNQEKVMVAIKAEPKTPTNLPDIDPTTRPEMNDEKEYWEVKKTTITDDPQNFFLQTWPTNDPGQGLFARKTGQFCIYFRGEHVQRLRESNMSQLQQTYSMRCGTPKPLFDTPTDECITSRQMPLAFFVQHQRKNPSHISRWYNKSPEKEKFLYLRPRRELKKGEEVCYDYNLDDYLTSES